MSANLPSKSIRAAAAIAALACSATLALAATADIANAPLATSTSTVRANVMLILDNSNSMTSDHAPDGVSGSGLCFGYSAVNTLFYDPNVVYQVPLQSTGVAFTAPNWPNAWADGYASTLNNVNLANAPVWSNASGNTNTNTFYYTVVDSSAQQVNCPDGSRPRLTRVTSLPSGQRDNYLIWYTYYRTRQLAMRGAVGTVMASLDATRFRIGISAISEPSTADNSFFLNIRDFDATSPVNQKQEFFSRLYSISDVNRVVAGTPLRPALEKIGKYYANKSLDGTALPNGRDPVQYSCQRNYTLLATDGYWTTATESGYRGSYAPTRLDGSTTIGNIDDAAASTPRPMLDDGRTQGNNWITGGAGVANTLADMSMYFYGTDLRTSALGNCAGAVANQDVCVNNVRAVGNDTVSHQHMTTFTLGLGVGGQLRYRLDYETATTGDFSDIRQGVRPWPNPKPATADNSLTATDEAARIDDVWHTAVNARGRYYAARNPDDIVNGLTNALQTIQSVVGTGAAAATSTLQPVTGDNFVYLGTYTTVLWEGNIKALTIDTTTGAVSTTPLWEAKDTLAAQVGSSSDSRNIYFFDASATNKLASFTYTNLNNAGKGALFSNVCSMASPLSQCATIAALGASVLSDANSGANLVNYLRGQRGFEDIASNSSTSRLFRPRATPLGDLVNAAPVYVKKPPFRYADTGYNTFASNNSSRTPVVYAAANDGMLHAFNGATGAELWAYVPTAVMPNMYKLADANYGSAHRFFVDGTPVAGDVFDGSNWRTIVVGGLGAGGRSYYALDVTDPANPKALWEFSSADDPDLGLTFGNPVITKNKAGTWVVVFSSGYNNVSPGTGNGYLFVRNAITGAAIAKIPTYTSGMTPAGDTTTPSNLGRISPWVNGETNNTALRFYGGDMLGNVWRIDFDDNLGPSGNEAMLLARAQTSGGVAQPITIRPQLTELTNNGNVKLVTIATGRLLGASDVGDTTLQSLYVFKDTLGSTGLGVLRSDPGMVSQTVSDTTIGGQNTRRINTLNTVNWSTQTGWYVDFNLTAGERVNVDTIQAGNLLAFASNIPTSSICTPGGSSWLYFFDISNGNLSDAFYGDAMAAGLNVVKLGTGLKIIRWNIRGEADVRSPGTGIGTPIGTLRRISWRELIF